jgi:hypothetical protein
VNQLERSALIVIAQKAQEAHLMASQAALSARGSLAEAVRRARECGEYLWEAKTIIGHGGFREWIEETFNSNDHHGGHFARETARKYMLLAKVPIERLQDIYTLRKAYMIAGCIDEPGKNKDARRLDPSGDNWIRDLADLSMSVVRWFDTRPLYDWSDMERAVFVERSKPVIQRWKEAAGDKALDEFASL